MYFVYILYAEKFDRYYIGQTDNLELRLSRHNSGRVKSTKHYIPWKLKYYEEFEFRGEALKRERFLKKQKSKEFYRRLISNLGPIDLDKLR